MHKTSELFSSSPVPRYTWFSWYRCMHTRGMFQRYVTEPILLLLYIYVGGRPPEVETSYGGCYLWEHIRIQVTCMWPFAGHSANRVHSHTGTLLSLLVCVCVAECVKAPLPARYDVVSCQPLLGQLVQRCTQAHMWQMHECIFLPKHWGSCFTWPKVKHTCSCLWWCLTAKQLAVQIVRVRYTAG